MKKGFIFCLFTLWLIPAFAFAGGAKETPAAAAAAPAAADVELGSVINQSFELIVPNDLSERGRSVVIERFKAAPSLREKVESGELPPVDDRLPVEPLVLEPVESIGRYGGSLRSLRLPIYLHTLSERLMLEHLVTWSMPYLEELNPNVAKAWDVSPDARVTTFFLREGMKWSDGTPFTADALVWWFEHIIKNDDLTPSKPAFLMTRGNLPTVTKIDDTTVRFEFTHPNPMFIENAARIRPMPYAPAHYLERFHPDFVSQAEISRLVREGDYDTWMEMFNYKRNFYLNPEIPSISAWIPLNDGYEEVARFGRNPYYWKVDSEGNQLPYIDGKEHPFVQDSEAWFLQALAGELSYASAGFIGGRPNLPLILENLERSDIRVSFGVWPPNNLGAVMFNFNNADPVKREVINDIRFRRALIKAIDYDEVNNVIYEGEAIPSWPASSDHLGQDHELYSRYIGRDVAEANRLLDQVGMTARDSDGYRRAPDGSQFTLIGLTSTQWPTETPEVLDLYRGYFSNIGIRMVVRVQAGQLVNQMVAAGEYDILMNSSAPGGRPLNIFDRGSLMPASRTWPISHPWAVWLLTNGAEGEEPPAHIKRLREIQEDGMVEPSAEQRDRWIEEALEIWVENHLVIPGYNSPRELAFFVFQNRLRNFAVQGRDGVLTHGSGEHHTTPSQLWYFD
ncbi:MAG: ABC transporter substrate-binding protein [Spirochaetaceae bacterium]|nr:MAG: ABC transporter substrate-binding protein [Spirochaetaceae bacterium]